LYLFPYVHATKEVLYTKVCIFKCCAGKQAEGDFDECSSDCEVHLAVKQSKQVE
jgi:hypothetical protein